MTRTRSLMWTILALVIVAAAATVFLVRTLAPAPAGPVLVTQPDFQPGVDPPCLLHQTDQPNVLYEGGSNAGAVPQLTFLAYYTAAGTKPFCDGQPPTDTDRAWAQLYVQLTTSSANVTTVLGPS